MAITWKGVSAPNLSSFFKPIDTSNQISSGVALFNDAINDYGTRKQKNITDASAATTNDMIAALSGAKTQEDLLALTGSDAYTRDAFDRARLTEADQTRLGSFMRDRPGALRNELETLRTQGVQDFSRQFNKDITANELNFRNTNAEKFAEFQTLDDAGKAAFIDAGEFTKRATLKEYEANLRSGLKGGNLTLDEEDALVNKALTRRVNKDALSSVTTEANKSAVSDFNTTSDKRLKQQKDALNAFETSKGLSPQSIREQNKNARTGLIDIINEKAHNSSSFFGDLFSDSATEEGTGASEVQALVEQLASEINSEDTEREISYSEISDAFKQSLDGASFDPEAFKTRLRTKSVDAISRENDLTTYKEMLDEYNKADIASIDAKRQFADGTRENSLFANMTPAQQLLAKNRNPLLGGTANTDSKAVADYRASLGRPAIPSKTGGAATPENAEGVSSTSNKNAGGGKTTTGPAPSVFDRERAPSLLEALEGDQQNAPSKVIESKFRSAVADIQKNIKGDTEKAADARSKATNPFSRDTSNSLVDSGESSLRQAITQPRQQVTEQPLQNAAQSATPAKIVKGTEDMIKKASTGGATQIIADRAGISTAEVESQLIDLQQRIRSSVESGRVNKVAV
ncbi:MAG: hypothetical protein DRR06_16305, partial [Gammaproteobacteria bacterium]